MARCFAGLVVLALVVALLRGEWSAASGQWSVSEPGALATGVSDQALPQAYPPPQPSPAGGEGEVGDGPRTAVRGLEGSAAKRGYELLTTKAYAPAIWFRAGYETAWQKWGLAEKPAEYDRAFRERYGLHPAPYPNAGLPMGLRETTGLFGVGKGITNDCMVCHASSIFGKSYVGLGNASLDLDALFMEMSGVKMQQGGLSGYLFPFSNVRGTIEAGAVSVFLLSGREPETLKLVKPIDLGMRTDLCEDTPPWWHLKKKTRMYYNGSTDARSVRALMLFALHPLHSLKDLQAMEPEFRDIQAYLKTIEPPKYPGKIDTELAAKGLQVFEQNCSSCHGTYGSDWTYPNKILPLKEIGTDPNRAHGISEQAAAHYERTWFAAELAPDGKRMEGKNHRGYVAPPLDGIWATAPYLHNGSVPTLEHLLNSPTRPARFTRSYRTDELEYDHQRVGWKFQVVDRVPANLPPIDQRKIYDTTQPGRKNSGHTFGDDLTDEERRAVIEYLKTL